MNLIFVAVRIIIAHNYTPQSFSVISWSLARHLASHGHEVLFFSHHPTIESPDRSFPGLTVVGWPEKRPTGRKSFHYYYQLHKSFDPQLVIFHFAPQFVAGIAAWLLKCPNIWGYYHTAEEANIVDTHQSVVMNRLRRMRRSWLYLLFDRIICVSLFAQQDIRRFFKIPINKLDLVYNALPDRLQEATRKPTEGPVQFHLLARLDPCKRVLETVEAFIDFKNQSGFDAILRIAGSGPLLPGLQTLIAGRDDIFYSAAIPYEEVDAFIRESHFLLCPSLVETFGMVNAEAMMNATPVLANAVGGIPEVVMEGKTGFLARSLATQDWVDLFNKACVFISNEPQAYAAMQQNCRALFLERFTISQYINNMEQKIKAIESQPGGSATKTH